MSQYLPWYVDALTAVFRCTYLGVSLTIQRYALGRGGSLAIPCDSLRFLAISSDFLRFLDFILTNLFTIHFISLYGSPNSATIALTSRGVKVFFEVR